MKVDLLTEKLKILQKKMEGYNYEVSLHFDSFEHILDLDLIKDKIKAIYPKANPEFNSLNLTDYGDLNKVVNDCFDYRGDCGAGLELNEKEEKELKLKILNFGMPLIILLQRIILISIFIQMKQDYQFIQYGGISNI